MCSSIFGWLKYGGSGGGVVMVRALRATYTALGWPFFFWVERVGGHWKTDVIISEHISASGATARLVS